MGTTKSSVIAEIKEIFGIDLSKENLLSRGEIEHMLIDKLKEHGYPYNKSKVLFQLMKNYLAFQQHRQKQTINPSTPVSEIIHRKDRNLLWKKMERELHIKLPGLHLSTGSQTFVSLAITAVLLLSISGPYLLPGRLSWMIFISSGIILLAGILFIQNRLRDKVPVSDLATLADSAVLLNFQTRSKNYLDADKKVISGILHGIYNRQSEIQIESTAHQLVGKRNLESVI